MKRKSRSVGLVLASMLGLVGVLHEGSARAQAPQPSGNVTPRDAVIIAPSDPIQRGQRVFWVGHSFHMFLAPTSASPGPVALLANEARFADHAAVGTHMIGGSTPMQHWSQGTDETNPVKVALRAGQVDVLTLASNAVIPEAGIDLFADLAFAHNRDVRVMIQESWGTFDNMGSSMSPADRDLLTRDDLALMRRGIVLYEERLRGQISAINARHGREVATLVPVYPAVVRFREEVLEGRVPGITKQTELFADGLGHAKLPLQHLVAYVWYAAMYRRSPLGLTSLAQADETSRAQHRVMQRIAWEAVIAEPASGVRLPTKTPPSRAGAASSAAAPAP